MAFKEQLTKLRKRSKMTQTELANKMNVKQYVVSSWETGRSEPNLSQFSKLSELFGVSSDYLLDKEVIQSVSESDFNKTIEMVKLDSKDEFLKDVNELCVGLSGEKKKRLLDVIASTIEFGKK